MDMSEMAGDNAARRRWLGVLALAPREALEQALAGVAVPALSWLRPPQAGLYMVRARAGGSGAQFNLGEVSVTRCAVQDEAGRIGLGYVRGGDARHAELVAIFDLLLQDEARRAELLAVVVGPLAERKQAAREAASRAAAATRVDFYTLARE
jgi:alpha-D-ribose 1-methylphosphonate 5-triphosphate synthase subunit PhnG